MILVGVLERMETLVSQYASSVNEVAAENPFELHVIFLDKALASWRPYLVFMTHQISNMVANLYPFLASSLTTYSQIRP